MPPGLDAFEQLFARSWPPAAWRDMTVLLAVSGGPDSIALARGMVALRDWAIACRDEGAGRQECLPAELRKEFLPHAVPGRLVVAHFNHGLRPGAAEADEAFVLEFCRRNSLPCHMGRPESDQLATTAEPAPPDDPAGVVVDSRGRQGFEARARQARYEFLRRTAEQVGARYIATAHTADDQAETILHNVVRGTGLAGLRGIPRTRSLGSGLVIVRPMLEIRRLEVLDYLNRLGQPYCTDATNADRARSRNRIRHDLLPRLEADYNARVVDALVRLGKLAGEAQQIVSEKADELAERCAALDFDGRGSPDGPGSPDPAPVRPGSPDPAVRIDCGQLTHAPEHLVCEMLKCLWRKLDWPQMEMGYDEWRSLAEMAKGETSADGAADIACRDFPGGIRATRNAAELVLRRGAT